MMVKRIDAEIPVIDESPEEEIVIYRHFLSIGPEIIFFFLVSAACYYYTVAHPQYTQEIDLAGFSFSLPLFLLFPVVVAAYLIHGLFNYKYVIRHHCVLGIEGVLSFNLRETRVDYEHVRGIEVDRSIYQRLLGLGDIKIGSAMKDTVEITMWGIFDPAHYRDVIESRLRKHVEAMEVSSLRQTIREELSHEKDIINH